MRLEEIYRILRQLYDTFVREYGDMLDRESMQNDVVVAFIFRGTKEYQQYVRNPMAAAHYEPFNQRLFLNNELGDPYGVCFHEGTHQLVHFASGYIQKPRTFWFEEGMATHSEAFKQVRKGDELEFVIHQVHERYLNGAKSAIRGKRWIPFKTFLNLKYQEFHTWARKRAHKEKNPFLYMQLVQIGYCEAWATTYFLYHYENGKYKQKFCEYFKRELKGDGGLKSFTEIFQVDLDVLEKQCKDYIKGLSP
jgi:hypothetical protein